MKYMKFNLIVLFLLGLILFQCTEQNSNPVAQPDTPTVGQLSFNMDMSNAPADVVRMEGKLFKEGQDTIFFSFEIKDSIATAYVDNIPSGLWTLQVDAYNNDGTIIYTGKTSVNVLPGEITPVYLHLNPTTGSLEIIVTWGNEATEPFLTFAMNRDSVWHILLIDQTGNGIDDLCEGKYPAWIFPSRNKFIYLAGSNELRLFDLRTRTSTLINYLEHSVNFLKYSKSLNKLLCDYHESPDYNLWNLGYMDLDGTNFTILLADSFSEKYPVSTTNGRWIYFHSNATGIRQIYRILPDGSHLEQVTFNDAASEFPAFSFNGQKMVYTKYIPHEYSAIVIRDLNSNQEKELELTNIGRPIYPTFTKNGKQIIFPLVTGENIADRQIFRINIDGTNLKQLTFDPNYFYYTRPIFW